MNYKAFCSTEINFSNKEELKKRLMSVKAANIVLLISESAAKRWDMINFIKKLEEKCNSLDGELSWIKDISPNPTQKDLINSLQKIGSNKMELIIAFGGGSALDLAKGIAAFYDVAKNTKYTIEEIRESIKNKTYACTEDVDIIAIPSTAGTGSELTQWATIWDENSPAKFSIDHPDLKAKLALIVPDLTLSVPVKMTLATGLDAMCQAIEAFWSKHTTPLVQEIAYRAIEIIIHNLRKAVEEPDNIDIRENLCKASVLSGLAFSQTRTTACHSISYPLTSLHKIPHGLAASISLDAVAKINKGNFKNDQVLFGLFAEYGGIMNWIDLATEGFIKMRLSAFGIVEEDIPMIVENAFTGGRMDNNPVDLNKDDVSRILRSIL